MESKYNLGGGIGAYKDNGTRAFVQTYTHNEVSIEYVDTEGQIHTEFIRIRIGTNEGQQIIMLENGKFYMINGYATKIDWKQELSTELIFGAITDIVKVNETIGNLLDLRTNEKTNLVKAINELTRRTSTPRKLVGYVKYLSDGKDPENAKDLEVRYNVKTQRFEYYSDLGEWVVLPVAWQKLNNIVRRREYLPTEVIDGMTYGILEEDVIVRYKNKEWVEVQIKDDEIGDEYIIRFVYNDLFNGNITGSIINTLMGWVYLINYNHI